MDSYDMLVERKIRPSVLRLKILDYILKNRTHPTIDEIYEELSKDNPTLSKTTVYNTTRVLLEHGLILQILIDGQQARYDGNVSEHGHFLCSCCSKIYDFPVLSEPQMDLEGFEVSEMKIYCSGVCKQCNSAK